MENNNWNITQDASSQSASSAKTFMASVFSWMFVALTITTIAAYYFASDMSLMSTLANEKGMTILGYVVMFAPLGFVLMMGVGFNKFSYSVLLTLFLAFAAIMGISLSFVLLIYTASSVYTTFASTAVMFGVMAALVGPFGKRMSVGFVEQRTARGSGNGMVIVLNAVRPIWSVGRSPLVTSPMRSMASWIITGTPIVEDVGRVRTARRSMA